MTLQLRPKPCPHCKLSGPTALQISTKIPNLVPNHFPGKILANFAKTEILSAENRICSIDIAIQRLKSQKRHLAKHYIAPRRSIISPIARIPEDVLLLIFDYCSHDKPVATSPNGAVSKPLIMAAICRRWRLAMLSYQHPWSILPVAQVHYTLRRDKHIRDRFTRLLRIHLQRAGGSLLRVSVSHEAPWSADAATLLLDSTDAWEELDLLDGSWKKVMEDALANPSHSYHFPSLRVLRMQGFWKGDAENGVIGTASDIFTQQSAPSLEEVTLENVLPSEYVWPRMPSVFPLRQLRRITLYATTGIQLPNVFIILSQCEQLEELEMTLWLFNNRQPGIFADHYEVTMPRLCRFHFTIVHGHHRFAYLLRHLTLPALRHISLNPPHNVVFAPLYQLIQRSACKIESMIFEDHSSAKSPGYGDFGKLPALLSSMKHLRQLKMRDIVSDNLVKAVFTALACAQAHRRQRRCPRLLSVQIESPRDEASLHLQNFIEELLSCGLSRIGDYPSCCDPLRHISVFGVDMLSGIVVPCQRAIGESDVARESYGRLLGNVARLMLEGRRDGVDADTIHQKLLAQIMAAVDDGLFPGFDAASVDGHKLRSLLKTVY